MLRYSSYLERYGDSGQVTNKHLALLARAAFCNLVYTRFARMMCITHLLQMCVGLLPDFARKRRSLGCSDT